MPVWLSEFLPGSGLTLNDNLEFLIRILASAGLGILVGLERSKRQKEAGVRTHCIIACTSAVFMILSKYAFLDAAGIPGMECADPSRIAAQVVSGISFLGAGVIFKYGGAIRGLTTAAGMWGTAAIGMAMGAGLYWVGLMEAGILIAIQLLLHRFPIGADAVCTQEITVRMEDRPELLSALHTLISQHQGYIVRSNMVKESDGIRMELSVRVNTPITHQEAFTFLSDYAGIEQVAV